MSAVWVGLLTGALLSMTAGYAITGWAFHRFQAQTPATWRRESWPHHVVATMLYAVAGAAIASLFVVMGAPHDLFPLLFLIGRLSLLIACCLLVQAVYVRWHLLVVVGFILEWTVLVSTVLLACSRFAR